MNCPYRMLAFDLDGTLLEADGSLAADSASCLRELAARGFVVAAATGRRLWSALPRLRGAGLVGSCVVHNGALVADIASASALAATPLAAAEIDAVVARLRERGLAPLFFTDAPRGPREILHEVGAPDPTGFLAWYGKYAAAHLTRMAPPLAAAAGEAVLRVVTHGSAAQMEALAQAVEAAVPTVRGFVQREMAVPGFRAELLSRRADKWQGIRFVARRHGIEPAAIVAVGDDANDVELLRSAGHSLAAPGAAPSALAAAKEALAGDGPRAVVAALRRLFRLDGKDSAGGDC